MNSCFIPLCSYHFKLSGLPEKTEINQPQPLKLMFLFRAVSKSL